MRSPSIKWIAPLAAFIITVSAVGVAYASTSPGGTTATTARTTATTAAGSTNGSTGTTDHDWMGRGQRRTDETALTGDVLAKVQAAVLAKIGSDATIMRAETDADGNAKYEVHAVKADGTHVTVYVNESYAVVSVETRTGAEGMGVGRGHMGGGETALTGDTLAKVKAAALAAGGNGSTLLRAFADNDNTDTSVKYEAMVKKSDGTFLMVYLDSAFKVVKTLNAAQGAGPGAGHGGGHRGGHGESSCVDGTAAAPSTSGTTSTTGSI